MESSTPLLRKALIGLAVFTVVLVVAGMLYRTPLKTVNIVNNASETITITTYVDSKFRVFSARPGMRANVPLADQQSECSEQSFALSTPTGRKGELSGQFCQDENHPVRDEDLASTGG